MQNDPLLDRPSQATWRALSGSETDWPSLLATLPVPAYACDVEGLITSYNPPIAAIWGRDASQTQSPDRYFGAGKWFSTTGTLIEPESCWLVEAFRSGLPPSVQDCILERTDGERVRVLVHTNLLRNSSGKVLGAVNVVIDITAHEESERTQAQLASIVESSDDAIVSKTLDGDILSWNAGAERLFGYTRQEAIGSNISLIIPPERIDEEREILQRLRRGQRIDHFETVRVSKSGQRIDISLTISPIFNRAGQIIGASKVARDITERKRAEAAQVALKDELAVQLADLRRLHEMSTRLMSTLELQPLLIEILNAATAVEGTDMGLLLMCNAEQTQLHVGASVGLSDDFLKQIEGMAADAGPYGGCMVLQRPLIIEDTEHDAAFDDLREVARATGIRAIHSTPLLTRSGKTIGVLSTHFRQPHRPDDREMRLFDMWARQAVDFIENARLYAELRETDQLKDEFLATLAHELRNPLAPLSNSLQILAMSKDLSPSVAGVREIMERQVKHLVRLVDDLLELSRITRGTIQLRKEPVALNVILNNAIEISRPVIDSYHHQLNLSLPDESLMLEADVVRLAQAFSNILDNAAKYTPEGGKIWLTARCDGAFAAISIKDTGAGIPPDMLQRVFEMFAQVDRTRRPTQGGLGIGLTLAKRLVQMHGGQIDARSHGLGRGSEFIVRLPLGPEATPVKLATSDSLSASEEPSGSIQPRKILIVDDTRAAAYILCKLLQMMGQDVESVTSGVEALEKVQQTIPDLIISDITMPEMDGYELARQIRRNPQLQGITLVALTGNNEDQDRQLSLDAGFDHHLVKPVSVKALQRLLASI